jgi:flavodoxin
MRKTTDFIRAISALAILAAGTLLTGCSSDDSIDMGEIDTNIGVGSDGFTFPSSSTNDIKLKDVLELKDEDCIEILANGDYQFRKGDTIDPARPKVKQVKFNKQTVNPEPLTVPVTTEMVAAALDGLSKNFSFPKDDQGNDSPGRVATFNFNNEGEKAVLSLTEADVKGGIDLNVKVTMLKEAISKVSLDIFLPNFFKLDETGLTIVTDSKYPDYQVLQLKNISTEQDLLLKLKVTQLRNFKTEIPTGGDNYMVVNPTIIQMAGMVKMLLTINTQDLKIMSPGTHNVGIDVDMGADFVATHAEGYFDPDIDIDPSTVDIGNDVPDFLNDEQVSIYLSNPTIRFHVKNNLDVEANINGSLTATYKDGKKKVLKVPNIRMKAVSESPQTTIVICRKAGNEAGVEYIQLDQPGETQIDANTTEVKDIAKILNRIPESISFDFDASANSTKLAKIDLYDENTPETDYSAKGRGYKIEPDYEFTAPLSLDAGSTIVYNDTIDGWNKDLVDNDIDMYEGTEIIVDADVHNDTPLQLNLEPFAIDVDKKKLNDITVTVTTDNLENGKYYVPSNYGTTANSKLHIVLKSSKQNAFKKLDGLLFKVIAEADKPGITLNSENQIIKASNLKIRLTGKMSINLDSKKD